MSSLPTLDAHNFSFATDSGRTYTVQYTDALLPLDWQFLTSLNGTGGTVTISDPMTRAQRYYRVRVQ